MSKRRNERDQYLAGCKVRTQKKSQVPCTIVFDICTDRGLLLKEGSRELGRIEGTFGESDFGSC